MKVELIARTQPVPELSATLAGFHALAGEYEDAQKNGVTEVEALSVVLAALYGVGVEETVYDEDWRIPVEVLDRLGNALDMCHFTFYAKDCTLATYLTLKDLGIVADACCDSHKLESGSFDNGTFHTDIGNAQDHVKTTDISKFAKLYYNVVFCAPASVLLMMMVEGTKTQHTSEIRDIFFHVAKVLQHELPTYLLHYDVPDGERVGTESVVPSGSPLEHFTLEEIYDELNARLEQDQPCTD